MTSSSWSGSCHDNCSYHALNASHASAGPGPVWNQHLGARYHEFYHESYQEWPYRRNIGMLCGTTLPRSCSQWRNIKSNNLTQKAFLGMKMHGAKTVPCRLWPIWNLHMKRGSPPRGRGRMLDPYAQMYQRDAHACEQRCGSSNLAHKRSHRYQWCNISHSLHFMPQNPADKMAQAATQAASDKIAKKVRN